jgi:(S)-2-hydroxyglutarate dehydrogenase
VFDYCIIGGGIVGVSTAWNIARRQPDASIVLLEKETTLAKHQTGHNSGVIHSGIYYEPGSLKAEYCRNGARLTKEFATEHDIPFKVIGKLMVATNDVELSRMESLQARAQANSISARYVSAAELSELEPQVVGRAALLIEETGIIDYGLVTRRLAEQLIAGGAELRTGVTVHAVSETSDQVTVRTDAGDVQARRLIACAGLQSDRIARMCGIDNGVQIVPFRGEYFQLPPHRADLVGHLIYPFPEPDLPFLGVHLSPTIDGRLTVGPNAVLGLAREKYPKLSMDGRDLRQMLAFPGLWHVARANVRNGAKELWNSLSKRGYLKECQKYCPALTIDDLTPREAGIRAQAVQRNGKLLHDFLIERTDRTVHVLNAPSPAATSALPIGQAVADMATAP